MLTEAIIILVLIILNGILSASEISIVSSRKARLQAESDKKQCRCKNSAKPKRIAQQLSIHCTNRHYPYWHPNRILFWRQYFILPRRDL
jgi:CBS domain containing-hemolysin-like protein